MAAHENEPVDRPESCAQTVERINTHRTNSAYEGQWMQDEKTSEEEQMEREKQHQKHDKESEGEDASPAAATAAAAAALFLSMPKLQHLQM